MEQIVVLLVMLVPMPIQVKLVPVLRVLQGNILEMVHRLVLDVVPVITNHYQENQTVIYVMQENIRVPDTRRVPLALKVLTKTKTVLVNVRYALLENILLVLEIHFAVIVLLALYL